MTAHSSFRTLAVCALLIFGGQSAAASSGGWGDRQGNGFLGAPVFQGEQPSAMTGAETGAGAEPERYAQADCSAAAAQAAAQTGGQVLSVSASNQGGQTVCVVTVLIPGQGGERPRRTTITIPG